MTSTASAAPNVALSEMILDGVKAVRAAWQGYVAARAPLPGETLIERSLRIGGHVRAYQNATADLGQTVDVMSRTKLAKIKVTAVITLNETIVGVHEPLTDLIDAYLQRATAARTDYEYNCRPSTDHSSGPIERAVNIGDTINRWQGEASALGNLLATLDGLSIEDSKIIKVVAVVDFA